MGGRRASDRGRRAAQVYELTVRETLALWAAYYPRPRPIAETIALAGLEEKASERVGRLSGGQRRCLDVGLALIGDPDLVVAVRLFSWTPRHESR